MLYFTMIEQKIYFEIIVITNQVEEKWADNTLPRGHGSTTYFIITKI